MKKFKIKTPLKNSKQQRVLLLFCQILLIGSCSELPPPPRPTVPADNLLLVTGSDFHTGFLSAISLSNWQVYQDIFPTHADATITIQDDGVFILNRYGADNLNRLNPYAGFTPLYEVSLGRQSNPQEIVMVSPSLAVVSLYEKDYLLLVNPQSGKIIDKINLAAWADSDGIPEVAGLYSRGDIVYAALQRLNRHTSTWQPVPPSYLLKISVSSRQVLAAYPLPYTNPVSRLHYLPDRDSLLIACPGRFALNYELDGGLVEFDLNNETFKNSPLTEEQAGFEITNAVIWSQGNQQIGYAIGLDGHFNSWFVRFNPTTATITQPIAMLPYGVGGYYADLALELTGHIYLADRKVTNPGVRIFLAATGEELTATPISIGLPPFSIAVFQP